MRQFLVFWSVFLWMIGISVEIRGQALFGENQVIYGESYGINSIYTADLDGDYNTDIIITNGDNNEILWYKNNGKGHFSDGILIASAVEGRYFIDIADIDNDADIDILFVSSSDEVFGWYENDAEGNFGEPHIIATGIKDIQSVHAAHISKDDYIDGLLLHNTSRISWFSNDSDGFSNIELFVSLNTVNTENYYYPDNFYTSDIDGDGFNEVISHSSEEIVWHERDILGNFDFEQRNYITTNIGYVSFIYPADLDGDSDIDIISISGEDTPLKWYENDGSGNFENYNTISTDFGWFSYPLDVDNDGDLDLLSTSMSSSSLIWYENDGVGNFSEQKMIWFDVDLKSFADIDDLDNDGDLDLITVSFDDGLVWTENLLNDKKITTIPFQDSNENGVYDNGEQFLRDQQIILLPSEEITFPNFEIPISFFVGNGDYQLTYQSNPLWELTTIPETYNITVNDNYEPQTYYFGFKPTRTLHRVYPNLSSSPTRCSQEATYWLHYTNTGTTLANGTIILEVDELMEFISSNPEPDLIEGRTLTWNITDLPPSFENKISLQFQMPDFNSMGEILETQASLQLVNENNELVYTKSTEYASEVLCSYDPNDKLSRSNILGQSETAYIGDTLLYTVRFQNTGNDVAFNIRIEDELDKKLDWTTFHPITASHEYRTELNRETGLVIFYFDDIMLPDSTSNEVESHGFVTFGIASLTELEDKTEVENTAFIFFDFNPSIVTNTVSNVLIELDDVGIEKLEEDHVIQVYPNPFSDFTTIALEGLPDGEYQLEVVDIFGRKVSELMVGNEKLVIERGELEAGLYLFRVESIGGELVGSGKVLVE